jgi:hypothetical protein
MNTETARARRRCSHMPQLHGGREKNTHHFPSEGAKRHSSPHMWRIPYDTSPGAGGRRSTMSLKHHLELILGRFANRLHRPGHDSPVAPDSWGRRKTNSNRYRLIRTTHEARIITGNKDEDKTGGRLYAYAHNIGKGDAIRQAAMVQDDGVVQRKAGGFTSKPHDDKGGCSIEARRIHQPAEDELGMPADILRRVNA